MFVIADQGSVGVGGQGGFAGSRKPEEDHNISFPANVGRAMHRRDTLKRKVVVHHREKSFLHLTSVPGAADYSHSCRKVEENKVLGIKPLLFPVGIGCLRSRQNHEIRLEVFQFTLVRPYEHVLDEVGLPCNLDYESH